MVLLQGATVPGLNPTLFRMHSPADPPETLKASLSRSEMSGCYSCSILLGL